MKAPGPLIKLPCLASTRAVCRIVDGATAYASRGQRQVHPRPEVAEREYRVNEVPLPGAPRPVASRKPRIDLVRQPPRDVIRATVLNPGDALRSQDPDRVDDLVQAVRPGAW